MTGASIPLAWENKNKLKQESEKNWNILQNLIEEKNSIEDNKYKNESAASPRRLNVQLQSDFSGMKLLNAYQCNKRTILPQKMIPILTCSKSIAF